MRQRWEFLPAWRAHDPFSQALRKFHGGSFRPFIPLSQTQNGLTDALYKRQGSNMSGKFLLRFDDICPTINWDVWQKLEDIMVEEDITPILSVIPDNQDPLLHDCEPNEHFWERVRTWQARGWTIGLHGYQHRYVNTDPGIV